MRTKFSIAIILSFALITGGCLSGSDSYKEITKEELSMLVDKAPPMQKLQLAENLQARQGIIKQIKEMFSVAQAAQAEGIEKDPKFQKRLALATDRMLGDEEANKSSESGTKAPSEVKKEETDAYVAAHGKDFDEFVAFATEGMKEKPPQEMIDGQKPSWAEMKIRAERGRKLGLEKTPEFKLQMKLQKAQLLASSYQEKQEAAIKPTEAELKEYYTAHPEADPEKVKKTAEDVLKRVKAGEDFAKLAKEFSADGSAQEGGKLRPFGKGRMVKEFEEAAYGLQKGQMTDLVKTQFGYHIIKLEDRQTRKPKKGEDDVNNEDEQEILTARHILFSNKESQQAEQKITEKKAKRLIEDLTLKYPVKAPDDFFVNTKGVGADAAATPGLQLPGGAGGAAPQGGIAPQGTAPQGSPATKESVAPAASAKPEAPAAKK